MVSILFCSSACCRPYHTLLNCHCAVVCGHCWGHELYVYISCTGYSKIMIHSIPGLTRNGSPSIWNSEKCGFNEPKYSSIWIYTRVTHSTGHGEAVRSVVLVVSLATNGVSQAKQGIQSSIIRHPSTDLVGGLIFHRPQYYCTVLHFLEGQV